jgi:hypothetical protein
MNGIVGAGHVPARNEMKLFTAFDRRVISPRAGTWPAPTLLFLCLFSVFCHAEELADNQARVGAVEGDVGLLSQGAQHWILPREGLPIDSGDQFRTSDDGRVELVLSEHMLVVMEPETQLAVERSDLNSGRVNLTQGAVLGKLNSAAATTPQQWDFNTPMAVCAVRGTEFALDVSEKNSTQLGVFEGQVVMQPAEGPSGMPPPVTIGEHQEGIIRRGNPVQRLNSFSPQIQKFQTQWHALRFRQRRVLNTWTPFTPATRLEARRRYVAPAPKRNRRVRPPARRRSKIPVPGGDNAAP